MKVVVETLRCKHCGSTKIVKFGKTGSGVQRLLCRACKKVFPDTTAIPGMKTPLEQVSSAVSMYYEGLSFSKIRRHLDHVYGSNPSDSTIYSWVKKFTRIAADETDNFIPDVGKTWIADETVLSIGGEKVWCFDVIDEKTRFLLATHLSHSRRIADVELVMRKALRRTGGQIPKHILTDQLAAYPEGIEYAFENRVKHIPVKGLTAKQNTNIVERFHGTLKSRTKVMRGLKKPHTAKLFLEGWLFYYNYLRPHEANKDKTPADKAGIDSPFENWADVVKLASDKKRKVYIRPKVTVQNLSPDLTEKRRKNKKYGWTPKRNYKKKEKDVTYIAVGEKGKPSIISKHPTKGAKRVIKKRGRIV